MTVKEQLLQLGMKEEHIDTHESDLYVLKNDTSEKWLSEYEFKGSVETFISEIDGQVWYDIPFGYANEHYANRHKV